MPSNNDSATPLLLFGTLPALEPDCACPTPPVSMPRPQTQGQQYTIARELYCRDLTSDWRIYCNTLTGGAPSVLNQAAIARLASFEQPQHLGEPIDEQFAAASLIKPLGTGDGPPQPDLSLLTVWLHVTNACNLDCPYCYVRKSAAKMSLEIGRKAIDSVINTARRHNFRAIKLKYAGGEAALHYRMVQQLHAYALEQTAQHNLSLSAVMLSNGTVLPASLITSMLASNIRLMVSVDGIGAEHDAQRPWKGRGGGAFAALERNLLEQLLPRGLVPSICITITGRTARTARATVEWAMSHDLPFSLNFYRENEQSSRYRELRFEEEQIISGLLDAYDAIEQYLPERPLLDGLLDHVQAQAHSYTCGVGQNYVVITHEGQAAQCQMDLQVAQPFSQDTDLIQLVSGGVIHNISVDEKEGCKSCRWRYRCAGGCPIVTLRATGRSDIKSPNCQIYQTLIPAALRLEGLRVLKTHGVNIP